MPFTFSHPAAILPVTLLPKKYYSLTGLVVGSIAPDFTYFIRVHTENLYGHTIHGLFLFDLPMGLLIALAYHQLVRNSLSDYAPGWIRSRIIPFKKFDWLQYQSANWIIVIISVLFGSATHLLWDSFTHENGYFVHIFHFLQKGINAFGFNMQLCKILQYLSTVFGGLVIVAAFLHLPEYKIPVKRGVNFYWFIFVIITLIIITIHISLKPGNIYWHDFIITAITGILLGLMITPLVMKSKVFE